MTRIIFVLLLAITLISVTQLESTNAYTNDCQGWAKEIRAGNGSKRMRLMGCHDKRIRGYYEPISGTCNYLARRQARMGYRTYQIPPRIQCAYDSYTFYYVGQYSIR